MYIALSQSQKRQRQRIDCMARQQAAQTMSAAKWQSKEVIRNRDDRQTPTIMAELQGRKRTSHNFETTIEESEKRIKFLIRPGEMKTRFEQFEKDTERKLPLLP
ncbi:hypothetical protein ACFX10_012118 [Malus domestica]